MDVDLQEKEILICDLKLRNVTRSFGYLEDPLSGYYDHIDNINILSKPSNILSS